MSLPVFIQPAPPPAASSVAVVVTCHEAYLPHLPACLMAINAQDRAPVQKILVLDGCGFPVMPCAHGWQVLHGDWGDPNQARNAALDCVQAEWVTYWDADNQMPRDYLAQMMEQAQGCGLGVAFVYPSVMRATAGGWSMGFLEAPEFDYWAVRERSVVDTASLWRVRAVKSIRWLEGIPCRDDHALVLRLTRKGWLGKKAQGVAVLLQAHAANRCLAGKAAETLWKARALAVVTLISGSDHFFRVHDCLMQEIWPADTQFYWVDDSANQRSEVRGQRSEEENQDSDPHSEFLIQNSSFRKTLMICADALRQKGCGVHILQAPPNHWPEDAFWSKHGRVADLYNSVLPGLREDIVLTLEDDVAPMWGAAKSLCEPLTGNNNLAAVAGMYEARNAPGRACVSMHPDVWKDLPAMRDVPHTRIKVGMVAGGCTAWANWALQRMLPMTITQGIKLGWDGTVCRALRSQGFEFMLDGRVECCHLCVPD